MHGHAFLCPSVDCSLHLRRVALLFLLCLLPLWSCSSDSAPGDDSPEAASTSIEDSAAEDSGANDRATDDTATGDASGLRVDDNVRARVGESDASAPDASGGTPYSEAYRLREELQRQARADLQEMGYELTNADFFTAVYTGEAVAVEFFLLAGARMDLPDDTKQMPLHVASIHGYDDIVEIMLSHDADPDVRSGIAEQTPLQLASLHGSVEAATHLLEAGANPNGQNDEGDTPIQVAALSGHEGLVQLLLSYGAEPDVPNETGHTALHAAAMAGERSIYRLLLESGANPNAANEQGITPQDVLAQL